MVTATMIPRLQCARDEFFLPLENHYLNCAYMGPLSRTTEEAALAGLRGKRVPSSITPQDFFEPGDQLRERIARLIGAETSNSIALLPAVSYGVEIVAKNTPINAGQNIVVLSEQFPANVYTWRRVAGEVGAELRTVSPGPSAERGPGEGRGAAWNRRILEAIDSKTALVTMGTVHWADGTLYDLHAIRRRTREVGAAFVLDGSQSVGALPIDVGELEPDALICVGYKWLLGVYGLSFGYFGPRYGGGMPLEETWTGRLGSENFGGLIDYVDEYQPGAIRFDAGQRSNFIAIPALCASLDLLLGWTPAGISAYCQELMASSWAALEEMGVGIEDAKWRSPHLTGLRLPEHIDPAVVKAALTRNGVSVSFRGTSVRVSSNIYNTQDDADALVRAVGEALG